MGRHCVGDRAGFILKGERGVKWGAYHRGLVDGIVDFCRWLWGDKTSVVAGTILVVMLFAMVYLVPWVQSIIQGVMP